jgi:DNA invertase Pin-like site-specific DNA recombinase
MMTIIGYARVSTDGQSLDAQRAALKSAGCAKIFAEKLSGVLTGRDAPEDCRAPRKIDFVADRGQSWSERL